MSKFILASASPRRRELLAQIGIKFEVCPSGTEEITGSLVPSEMVKELSGRKAEDIFNGLSKKKKKKAVVIGADTLVFCGGRIMGKPGDKKAAVEMLQHLQGRSHQVYTGVTLCCREEGCNKKLSFYEETEVTMFPMTEEEIKAYVKTGEPMDKAGAYGIQGKGAAFIKEIKGDYNNVVGLPAARLYQELKGIVKDFKL